MRVMIDRESLLKLALILSGAGFLLIYPLAIVWPSGWAWHQGAPYSSEYFMSTPGGNCSFMAAEYCTP
jgi:hypothetical protein